MKHDAAILSIGDELVLGQSLDTNSQWISRELLTLGWRVAEHRTVDDDIDAIETAILELSRTTRLLLITGGLGPTEDDLTRSALGRVFANGASEPLIEDEIARTDIEDYFAGRGGMSERNRTQALRPPAMSVVRNPHGTAPGLLGEISCAKTSEAGQCRVLAMPGPPREMRPMFERMIRPWCRSERPGAAIATRFVRMCGIGESDAAERIADFMQRENEGLHGAAVGTTASGGIVTARIRVRGDDAESRADGIAREVQTRWTPYAFGTGDTTLAESVQLMMVEHKRRLVTAESCTGGMIGAACTDVAGSSAWYDGGWVTYTNAAKVRDLGVRPETLERDGAVSQSVAEAMATGALRRTATDTPAAPATDAIAVTGIAGPGGGSDEKPVGTVWIAHAWDHGVRSRRLNIRGERDLVRRRTVVAALQLARLGVLAGKNMIDDVPRLLWETPR